MRLMSTSFTVVRAGTPATKKSSNFFICADDSLDLHSEIHIGNGKIYDYRGQSQKISFGEHKLSILSKRANSQQASDDSTLQIKTCNRPAAGVD